MMDWPLVSIITVNYDQPGVTCELLESLRAITYPNIEVIVVDNASPNRDPEVITDFYSEAKLIRSDENLGFAGGNNLGIREAKGEYVLLLNNDTEVDKNFLEPLVRKISEGKNIGAVSPKIKFYHNPNICQYTGYSDLNPYTIRSKGFGYKVKDNDSFDNDQKTAFVHGAAMLIPMDVIRKVGLMAESYFLYYEELDWGIRIRNAGYDLWYVHDSVVYHKESVSVGKLSTMKLYYMNRARLLYLRRNVHGFKFFAAILYFSLISVPKNVLAFALSAKLPHLKAYIKAISWHLKNLFAKEIHSNPVL